jgi:DNA-directed RNA polymerase subunit beta
MTPEEKLLRAIFGEKASDVRDTSLRLPPGVNGTVVEVRVFNRHGVEKDERAMAIEREEIERLAKDRDDELQILDRNVYARLKVALLGKEAAKGPKNARKGTTITEEILSDVPRSQWWEIGLADESGMAGVEAIGKQYEEAKKSLERRFVDKVDKLQRGDELPPGVMKMVKVFVAVKRKIQPGDKMAGRHGNKGVVSQIVPIEDMPYLEDGTHVDVVLNPLGVPNMSHYACPRCGHEADIFGAGGGERLAEQLDVPFLGRIPIYQPIREGGDSGQPLVISEPESPAGRAIFAAAERAAAEVSIASFARKATIPLTPVR